MIEFQSAHPVRGATFFGFRILPAPLFQSTRPVWGATATPRPCSGWRTNFNPRAPCGARPRALRDPVRRFQISIHAPRVGRDFAYFRHLRRRRYFNPRAPCGARRATGAAVRAVSHFNPRAPCGARLFWAGGLSPLFRFQSTRPVWGATTKEEMPVPKEKISIHAPRVGRDSKFDDFTPSNLHKRYKRVLARPKNTREKGKIKQKLAYIHAFSAFLGCEGSGTFCALVLRTQYR